MSEARDLVQHEETMPEQSHEIPLATPLVDIYENEDEILLHTDMPGVNKEDVSITIDNGTLTINGVRTLHKGGAVKWEEFGDVRYQRSFSVPQSIDVEKVNAEMKNGVLYLHLLKSEQAKPRQIEIKTG